MKQTYYFAAIILLFLSFGYNRSKACDTPSAITVAAITTSSATISWNAVIGATSYKLQYRAKGTTPWTVVSATSNSKELTGLEIGTRYEAQVRSICSAQKSPYSSTQTFQTLLPTPDHIVICIMENKAYDQIIGSSLADYINSLATDVNSVLFTQSYALTHPSQPNYLNLFSGDNQGVTSSNCITQFFTTENLGYQLIAAGKSYATYSEDLPSVGFDGCSSGKYVRRHNPAANWMGTGLNQIPASTNQPFTAFPTDYSTLPTISLVIPNLDNDMHSGGIKVGDMWLEEHLDSYIQWAKTHNSLFILTWDEDDDSSGNHIATIFTGEMMKYGNDSTHIDHFNVLRTLEDMYGLTYAGEAANVDNISGVWKETYSCSYTNVPAKPASISGPTSDVCSGNAYAFSCPVVANATLYNWTVPGGGTITSGQGTNSITATMPSGFVSGKISVNASNCFGASANRSITVYGIPPKPGAITGATSVCANQMNVQYSIASVSGASNYKWTVPAGATIASGQGSTSITVNYGPNGGTVKVLAKSSCGSSPNRALMVSVTCKEGELSMAPFSIYPNPTSDEFLLKLDDDESLTVSINDISGGTLIRFQNASSEATAFGKDFPAGVYFVEVTNSSDGSWVKKVVKE